MKTIYLLGALSLLALSSQAAPLDFTSVGALSCGSASNCSEVGGNLLFTNNGATMTISYAGNTESDLNVPVQPGFTGTNFGSVAINCSICAGITASFNLTGAIVNLGINQGPDPFNASTAANVFSGAVSGTLTVTSGSQFGGNGTVFFTPTNTSLASGLTTVNYYMQQPQASFPQPAGYGISIGNVTTFQGAVDMVIQDPPTGQVPEPATIGMVGFALLGLGLAGRRK